MDHFGYVLATKLLVDGKRKVRFMYREQPDDPRDSGWRFFCGDEDDAYVSDPANIGVYDIRTIISLDSSVVPYLSSPAGSALEREYESDPFEYSLDFPMDEEGE
ncbi:MAG: DUF2185 domain-containing protein [Oscillospiraceae bacterium]|nr:DUF2185 domain-containing protein [Oscillospiraceae bacterium]